MSVTLVNNPLNIKHGRETQLQIVGYLPESHSPAENTLVVIEQTALDLEQQIPFYLQTCEQLGGLELIDQLEPEGRGLYAGTVGYFGSNGDMDQAITIRTLVFQGNHYNYQAGAGIVADSESDYEYREVSPTKQS